MFVLAVLLASLLLFCHVHYAYLFLKNSVICNFAFLRNSLFVRARIKRFDACRKNASNIVNNKSE